jgi:hypothetical protein
MTRSGLIRAMEVFMRAVVGDAVFDHSGLAGRRDRGRRHGSLAELSI